MQNSFSEKNLGAKFFVKSTLLLKTILSPVLDVEEALQVGGTAVYRDNLKRIRAGLLCNVICDDGGVASLNDTDTVLLSCKGEAAGKGTTDAGTRRFRGDLCCSACLFFF